MTYCKMFYKNTQRKRNFFLKVTAVQWKGCQMKICLIYYFFLALQYVNPGYIYL